MSTPAKPDRPEHPATANTGPRRLRVIIVEDREPDVELMLRELHREGYEPDHLRVESEADLARAMDQGPWDVVLADYALPAYSGLEAMEFVRRAQPHMPFILVTGTMGEEAAVATIKAGVNDYILKDNLRRLGPAVTRELDAAEDRRHALEAQEALRRQQWLLQTIFDHLPLIVYVLDADLRFRIVNQRMAHLQQTTPAKLLGLRHEDLALMPAEPRNWLHEQCAQALSQGEPLHHPDVAIGERKGKPRYFNVWIIRLRQDVEEARVLVVGHEITDQKLLQQQLSTAQRMESIGRLAGGIAHDFNNMLSVIESYAAFLKEAVEDNPQAVEDAGTIQEAAHRSSLLTRQLLAFSRRQVQKLEPVSINDELRQLEKMLTRLIGEDIRVVMKLASDLHMVRADAAQIEQIIMNICVNARDAMPKGGTLTIETENVLLDRDYAAEHVGVEPGPYVLLAISDSGVGMPREVQERIFEPFFTTKGQGNGTGLGLATVYGIVKQSGGNVWVYSEEGKGTTFKVYLPAMQMDPLVVQPAEDTPSVGGGNELILVVEDEALVRSSAVRILRRAGYEVLEAGDADTAEALAAQHAQALRLLLTDVIMPNIGGPELADRITARHPELTVVYMSGYTDDAIVNHGVLEEGIHLIQKPFSRDSLLEGVDKALRAGQRDSPTST